jgi:hypothetical protein
MGDNLSINAGKSNHFLKQSSNPMMPGISEALVSMGILGMTLMHCSFADNLCGFCGSEFRKSRQHKSGEVLATSPVFMIFRHLHRRQFIHAY